VKGRENIWRQRAGLLTFASLFLLANVGFLVGSRSIRAARKQALENRRASLTSQVAAREAEAKKLTEQRDRLAQVSEAIDDFYGRRVGSRRQTLAPLVQEVHTVMRKAGVAPNSISYSTSSLRNLPLTEMSISFSFRSDYARFKRLLAAFEVNPRWLVVRDVGLSRDSETVGEVQVRLALATYFSNEDRQTLAPGPAAPAAPAPARKSVRSVERTVQR
jgi:Tfp pilus assembly protein PilO